MAVKTASEGAGGREGMREGGREGMREGEGEEGEGERERERENIIFCLSVCQCECSSLHVLCTSLCVFTAERVQPRPTRVAVTAAAGFCADISVVEHQRSKPTTADIAAQ